MIYSKIQDLQEPVKICFLFNHYFVHQVPHAVPYAFELSRQFPQFDCIIACSGRAEMQFAREISSLYPGHRCSFLRLSIPWYSWYYRFIDLLRLRPHFRRKSMVLRHNLEFFRKMDAIIAPERNFFQLKTRFGLEKPMMIHCRHGAGDRAGGFVRRLRMFDFLLLPGQKVVDRLNALGYLREGRYAAAGYPKFEVVRGLKKKRNRLFANDNPVVVYNPHFDRAVSSWEPMGLKVLEFFKNHPEYNLIFAPHVILFKRKKHHRTRLPGRYFKASNIHVDLGSTASADMTYTLGADIYLGDVSSQVYEFLLEPRPCIFLNGHQVEWKDDSFYYHWNLGQVVDDVPAGLEIALKRAFSRQKQYEKIQKEAFNYTFYNEPGTTAAERGARAVVEFLFKQLKKDKTNA